MRLPIIWSRLPQSCAEVLPPQPCLPSRLPRCWTCIVIWRLSWLGSAPFPLILHRNFSPQIFWTSNPVLASATQRTSTDTTSTLGRRVGRILQRVQKFHVQHTVLQTLRTLGLNWTGTDDKCNVGSCKSGIEFIAIFVSMYVFNQEIKKKWWVKWVHASKYWEPRC